AEFGTPPSWDQQKKPETEKTGAMPNHRSRGTKSMPLNPFRKLLLAGAALAVSAGLAPAQVHSYAPADIEAGMGLYQANCLGCHGDRGDAVEGANLSTGRFRRVSSDEDMIRLLRIGIPNTPMPPHDRLSTGDLRMIVAFVRS